MARLPVRALDPVPGQRPRRALPVRPARAGAGDAGGPCSPRPAVSRIRALADARGLSRAPRDSAQVERLRRASPRRRPARRATSRSVRPEAVASLTISVALVVADVRVQRRRRPRASTRPSASQPARFASIPSTHFSANRRDVVASSADRLQQVARDQRDAHVQLELALHAADRDRRVVADHLRADLQHDLGDHRVDLARHDRRALLQLRQEELADARRAGRSPSARGRSRSSSATPRPPSARRTAPRARRGCACASNGSSGGRDRQAGRPRRASPRTRAANSRVRVEAGAGRGAAERDLRDLRQRVRARARAPSRICAA